MADETYYEQTVSIEVTKNVVAHSEGDARRKAVDELNDEVDDGRRFEIRDSTVIMVGDTVDDVEPETEVVGEEDVDDDPDTEDVDADESDDDVELPSDYGELQELAKEHGIKANQSTEALEDALREELK